MLVPSFLVNSSILWWLSFYGIEKLVKFFLLRNAYHTNSQTGRCQHVSATLLPNWSVVLPVTHISCIHQNLLWMLSAFFEELTGFNIQYTAVRAILSPLYFKLTPWAQGVACFCEKNNFPFESQDLSANSVYISSSFLLFSWLILIGKTKQEDYFGTR